MRISGENQKNVEQRHEGEQLLETYHISSFPKDDEIFVRKA